LQYSAFPKIVTDIHLNQLKIEPLTDFVSSFSDSSKNKTEKPQKIKPVFLSLLANTMIDKIEYQNKVVYNTRLKLKWFNTRAELDLYNASICNGSIYGSGFLKIDNKVNLIFDAGIKNIDLTSLTTNLLDKKYISGNMQALLRLKTEGETIEELGKNFLSIGIINLSDGILFDKANFLKPVFSLDKIVSIQKTDTNFSKYKKMNFDFLFVNNSLQIKNFYFDGMGIHAEGYANIESREKIDTKITVQLGGFVGKAVKIPIVYNSKAFSLFEIDRVWMASVYAGTVFLAGPAGTILGTIGVAGNVAGIAGGLAGSAMSDNVDSSWERFKKLFKKEESSE
jgi:hypothetical protein